MFIRSVLFFAVNFCRASGPQPLAMANKIPEKMKAIGFYQHLNIENPESLQDIEVYVPSVSDSEVLVEVKAVGMNPIDTKVRTPGPGKQKYSAPKILGWDGSGVVVNAGKTVQHVKIGEEVMFTGDLRKNGANAQYVALDQILVAPKPENLTFEEAAAMPLTSVTAYEALYDRLELSENDKGKTLLLINSAGGVGSVASQLAKNLGMVVIGTASRPETEAFTKRFGADIVLNHKNDLIEQLKNNGYNYVDYIMVNYDPFPYWDVMMQAIAPQGKICQLVDSSQPVDIRPLKDKSVTLVSEMMNTRIKYDTPDKDRHRVILNEVSKMLKNGQLKTTLNKVVSPINAANLREAHSLIEGKKMIGKLVLSGF